MKKLTPLFNSHTAINNCSSAELAVQKTCTLPVVSIIVMLTSMTANLHILPLWTQMKRKDPLVLASTYVTFIVWVDEAQDNCTNSCVLVLGFNGHGKVWKTSQPWLNGAGYSWSCEHFAWTAKWSCSTVAGYKMLCVHVQLVGNV